MPINHAELVDMLDDLRLTLKKAKAKAGLVYSLLAEGSDDMTAIGAMRRTLDGEIDKADLMYYRKTETPREVSLREQIDRR